jgi:hypothetical protein
MQKIGDGHLHGVGETRGVVSCGPVAAVCDRRARCAQRRGYDGLARIFGNFGR